jgi:protein subunit release factor A
MDINEERLELRRIVDGHQQRIEQLRERIDRSMRELRLHEMISSLAGNKELPEAVRSLAAVEGVESAASTDIHNLLAERGLSIPTELEIRALGGGDKFSVFATYPDDSFPTYLSWSSEDGFQGQIVNNFSSPKFQGSTAAEGAYHDWGY